MSAVEATLGKIIPTPGHCEWCGALEAAYRVVGTRACGGCSVATPGERVAAALKRWGRGAVGR